MNSPHLKPLQINVPEEKRIEVKVAAAQRGITLKEYILRAVDFYEKNVVNK